MDYICDAPKMLQQLLAEPNKDKFLSEVPSGLDRLVVEFVERDKIPCPIIKSEDQTYINVVEAHYGIFAASANDDDDISILTVAVKL